MQKKGYTYILFNKRNGTLYVGVASDLKNRVMQHKEKVFGGFTKKNLLREKKIALIQSMNPEWDDLFFKL